METSLSHEQNIQAAEERPTEHIEQSSSSPPGDTGISTFATNTIDIRLVVQPEDGHPDGRRIRYVIALDGKTLHIGAVRIKQGTEMLPGLEKEQTVAQFTQWIARLADHQQTLVQCATRTPAPQLTGPSAYATPKATLPAPAQQKEAPKEATQGDAARHTQASGKASVPSPSVAQFEPVKPAHGDQHAIPEQLMLF